MGESSLTDALGLTGGGAAGAPSTPEPSAAAGATPAPAAPAAPAAPSATGGSLPQEETEIPPEYHKDPRWQKVYGRMKDAESWKAENERTVELGRIMRLAQEGDQAAARMVAAHIGAETDVADVGAGAAAGVPAEAAAPLSRAEFEQTLMDRDQRQMRQQAVLSKIQQMHRDALDFKDEDVYAAMIDRGINDPEDAYYVLNREAITQAAIDADRAAQGRTAAAQVAASQNVPPGISPSAGTVPSSDEPTLQSVIVQAKLAETNPMAGRFPGLGLGPQEG